MADEGEVAVDVGDRVALTGGVGVAAGADLRQPAQPVAAATDQVGLDGALRQRLNVASQQAGHVLWAKELGGTGPYAGRFESLSGRKYNYSSKPCDTHARKPLNGVVQAILAALVAVGLLVGISFAAPDTMDLKTTGGALLSILVLLVGDAIGVYLVYAIEAFCVGVDFSKPRYLDSNGSCCACLPVPSPLLGLVLGIAMAVGVICAGANIPGLDEYLDWGTVPGRILLAFVGILTFILFTAILPIPTPNGAHAREVSPGTMRRVGRYLVPLIPVLHALGFVAVWAQNWVDLLTTPSALSKVGTMPFRIHYTTVPGQPIRFCRAADITSRDDRALVRNIVNLNSAMENLRRYLKRDPVPTPTIVSDAVVWSMCSKTVLAYNVRDLEVDGLRDDLGTRVTILDMSVFEYYETNPGRFFPVKTVTLLRNTGSAGSGVATEITMRDDRVIRPSDGELWGVAKVHFVSTINLFAPALQHNWVHFHMPDNATSMSHNVIPRGSRLHKFIQPFVLANTKTNANGLGGLVMANDIGQAPSFMKYIMTVNQTSNEFFVNSVRHRTMTFYTGQSSATLAEDIPLSRLKFGYPPQFPENDVVPYTRCLKTCLTSFQKFAQVVVDVATHDGARHVLQHWADQTVSRTTQQWEPSEVKLVDVLAGYMWQVSVLHSLDHQAFFTWCKDLNTAAGARKNYNEENPLVGAFNGDDIRIHQNFMNVAGFYHRGTPDDSLGGVTYADVDATVDAALAVLKQEVNAAVAEHVNEVGGPQLDVNSIASAILM